jgi:hypothetical protein
VRFGLQAVDPAFSPDRRDFLPFDEVLRLVVIGPEDDFAVLAYDRNPVARITHWYGKRHVWRRDR